MCPDNTHAKKQYLTPGNDIHYPGQTNHDACFIPVSVRQYAGEPLYIIVAHWCLLQQNWVQRNQIAEAFHITARRASYLIAYLRSKTSRVVSICRHQTLPNKARRYEIYVIRFLTVPPRPRVVKKPDRRRYQNAGSVMVTGRWQMNCGTGCAVTEMRERS
ncbi:CaiF/GrlA family transcriptional regulator [Salmonella enterica subsp. enterica serovar Kentucky]